MVAHKKKARKKIGQCLLLLAAIASALIILYTSYVMMSEKTEIIYFRNDRCEIVRSTDEIMSEAARVFGGRIDINTIEAHLDPSDPEDSEYVKRLREAYGVIGLPEIIINGQKFTREFTQSNLFTEICNSFILKPEACP